MSYSQRGRTESDQKQRSPVGEPKSRVAMRSQAIMQRVADLVAADRYERAVDFLNSAGNDSQMLNAKGVCLLRAGRIPEAIRLFRSLVLAPGCTWVRPRVPAVYLINYAWALLLGGHPSGCLEMMADLPDKHHPGAEPLRAAIKNWEAQLSLLAAIELADRPD